MCKNVNLTDRTTHDPVFNNLTFLRSFTTFSLVELETFSLENIRKLNTVFKEILNSCPPSFVNPLEDESQRRQYQQVFLLG